MGELPVARDPRVLVDYRTGDDAGVYQWAAGPALVQTVDFFTPIVDDPYTYGQIAAANALSDVYAMGGQPLTALAVAAFPADGPGLDVVRAIVRGGYDKLREAGVVLLGGHTIQDREIKFGYAVTGAIDPARVLTNAGARPGDVLLLTKRLGTGLISTAIKFGRAPAALVEQAIRSMATLNRAAADVLAAQPTGSVHACTDVTGFGLVGHACELAQASGVTVRIAGARVPLFDGVLALARRNRTGGGAANREYFGSRVALAPDLDPDLETVLYDPQTSGGLLIALDSGVAEAVESQLRAAGVDVARVGGIEERGAALVRVE